MNVTDTLPGETVVMPDTADQCLVLFGSDTLITLGDFARNAGFSGSTYITQLALRQMLGQRVLDGPPDGLITTLHNKLSMVHELCAEQSDREAFVLGAYADGDDDAPDLLVRQNHVSEQPYTLITLR